MSTDPPRFGQDAVPADAIPPSSVDPADANVSLEWLEVCAKIGLTVVAVKAPYSPQLWENSGFEEDLGRELHEAKLGFYDSVKHDAFLRKNSAKQLNRIVFFFCVPSKKLPAALQFIRAKLAAIGLLHSAKIAYADPESITYRRVLFLEDGKAGA
jgi:hypothetical protein